MPRIEFCLSGLMGNRLTIGSFNGFLRYWNTPQIVLPDRALPQTIEAYVLVKPNNLKVLHFSIAWMPLGSIF